MGLCRDPREEVLHKAPCREEGRRDDQGRDGI